MSVTLDIRSKLVDGLLSFVVMFLLMGMLIVLMKPFEAIGGWGMWSYLVLMFALGIGTLWLSIQERFSEVGNAWLGILGGMCAWSVTEMAGELGFVAVEDWDGIVLLLLTVATTAVLWRFFPVGPKFWFVLLFLNWGGHVFIKLQRYIFAGQSLLETTYLLTVISLLLVIVAMLYWIFVRATTRIQRLWSAVYIWSAVSIIFFILR
ncbi:MAG: hypothetical protein IAF02_10265 [Anaerolineae bacterium]|nr:hypothetical protein [Anaerolineae bacterium]